MTKFKKQMVAAISAGSMFLSMVTPALASTTIEVTGNGANSDNTVEVKNKSTTTVVQTNSASVTTTVNTSANTGGNDANQNTGGSVLISTGNAKTKTDISNLLNSNRASVDCCNTQDVDVLISGNGAYSDNEVEIGGKKHSSSNIRVHQANDANVSNEVDAKASTGKNDANQNTNGDVLIHTGNAVSLVDVSTTANANWAQVGGSDRQGSLSARILGNGANSDNEIELKLDNDITLVQANAARVRNEVDARASTGKNDANQNTGGDVLIATGDALTDVEIDNMVNFNWADVDCGCLTDLLAKISGNGANSDNEIEFRLDSDLYVPQENVATLLNLLDGYAKTGKNDVNQNTGTPDSDPGILTGDAWSYTNVSNTANLNSYGVEGSGLEMPDFEFEFSFSLNLMDFLRFLRWM